MDRKRLMWVFFYTLIGMVISQQVRSQSNASILSKQEVSSVVDSIKVLIKKNYYDPSKAKSMVEELEKRKLYYLKYSNKDSLSKRMSLDLKNISNDSHMYLQVLKKGDEGALDWEAYETEQEIKKNFGFMEIQILSGNIGYMKIIEFMHPHRSMPTAVAALKLVENTEGLIIDLRDNGGGYPGIMEYILGHYFKGAPELLSRTLLGDGSWTTTFTTDLLMGKLRIDTPLYILINERTASAAEYMAYALQAYKKAKIVGQKSAGGANRNEYFLLPSDFRISISVSSPLIIKTDANWEGVGVIPEIISMHPKEDALIEIRQDVGSE